MHRFELLSPDVPMQVMKLGPENQVVCGVFVQGVIDGVAHMFLLVDSGDAVRLYMCKYRAKWNLVVFSLFFLRFTEYSVILVPI
jgi:hypothetical protein